MAITDMMTDNRLRQIIKTAVRRVLMESMQPSFDWNEFNRILKKDVNSLYGSGDGVYEYCVQHLGEPIGYGSSRAVFEIDDYTVLKLSIYLNHVEQNVQEYNTYQRIKNNPLVPRIYGKDENYIWLWTEKVIPAQREDYEHILGITYDQFLDFVEWYTNPYSVDEEEFEDEIPLFRKLLNNEWFKHLIQLMNYVNVFEMTNNNIGIAMRNGKPTMVVLDIGV